MRAGGRATEAGISFQAAVATWFAVHLLVRMPVGGRFGINNQAIPVAIRLETGEGMDDIKVSQSDSGALQVQCKTNAGLSTAPDTPLGKTVGQLARWVADAKAAGGLPNPTRSAALLAVRADAPRTLDDLESGCRAFDLGGAWASTRSQRNRAHGEALDAFQAIAIPAWTAHRGAAPDDGDLVDMARIFHVARFRVDEGDSDWRESSRLLGRRLYGDEAAGDAPLRDLMDIMRGLLASGAPAERDGLLRELRQRGHNDVGSPGFEADVRALRTASARELARLAPHARLPLGAGVPIARASDRALVTAMLDSSLLVIGEPGAGKTGALVNTAAAIAGAGHSVVFLSVDRFPGVAIGADLASELGLAHPVVEVLAAMPGAGRRVLIIDALDAARSGPSEAVFAKLIEDVRERVSDWIVVASIRTFDLKNGRRFRQAFAGSPADARHAEHGLSGVRHFLVPRLSEADLAAARASSPGLDAVLASAPPRLAELLRNVYNLSLAVQLLSHGADAAALGTIRSQSGLIDAYEDVRLDTTQLQQAAGAVASLMVAGGRLAVRKVAVTHGALDAVIQTGVLVESGDLVSFPHHVLFDHVASRFHLAWNDPGALLAQLAGDTSTALRLAPALRFAVERLWRDDNLVRARSWQLVTGIFMARSVDPVLGNVALRVVVENIDDEGDVTALMARVAASPTEPALVALLGRLARFAAMEISAARAVSPGRAIAWARLAEALVATGERELVDPARVLLYVLFEHGDLADVALLDVFGRGARALLELAWAASPPLATASGSAIRFVGKSFASAPAASRALLDQILREPHFSQYADREARWLAEQILPITRSAPEFTVEIYAALYGQSITDGATSWLGGQPSRILALRSSRREDYKSCLWQLGSAMGQVLAISPGHGTRALIEALIAKAGGHGAGDHDVVNLGTATIELRGCDIEFNAWDERGDAGVPDDDLLHHYVGFLRACDPADFASSVAAASRDYATASVWARILGVGSERVAEVGDLLWPLIERPDFLENDDTLRDAVRLVTAAWSTRSRAARHRFETMALDEKRFTDADDLGQWHRILGRILALVSENALESDEMRALRRTLDADGLLAENAPNYQDGIYRADYGDFLHDRLRRAGVALDGGPNHEVLEAANALQAHVQGAPTTSTPTDLAALWRVAVDLLERIDRNPGLNDYVEHSAWGNVANAVERVASSPDYTPGSDGQPDLATMLAVLRRLSSSRYPEPREPQARIGWGSHDVRVCAAKAMVSLAPRFAVEHPVIVDLLDAMLADPAPAVRLQVAQSLQVIHRAAPERMWAIGQRLAAQEQHRRILAGYLGYSMRRFSHSDPERCEIVLAIVKARLQGEHASDGEELDHVQESLGGLLAQLYVGQGRALERAWLEEWAADPVRFECLLNFFISHLRGTFFDRYQPEAAAEARTMCDRAQEGLALILASATTISARAYGVLASDANETDKQAAGQCYGAAEKVIHHAMNQLYFGSGAHAGGREGGPGLPNPAAMRRFLADYAAILVLLANTREPGTLHHLIELYEFLIPADPVAVFGAIHAVLVGRGEEEGYHFESLGNTAVVGIVQRYIADYRDIFEDDGRRAQLVAILQLFSQAGWPEALKLLYDLPDLLR